MKSHFMSADSSSPECVAMNSNSNTTQIKRNYMMDIDSNSSDNMHIDSSVNQHQMERRFRSEVGSSKPENLTIDASVQNLSRMELNFSMDIESSSSEHVLMDSRIRAPSKPKENFRLDINMKHQGALAEILSMPDVEKLGLSTPEVRQFILGTERTPTPSDAVGQEKYAQMHERYVQQFQKVSRDASGESSTCDGVAASTKKTKLIERDLKLEMNKCEGPPLAELLSTPDVLKKLPPTPELYSLLTSTSYECTATPSFLATSDGTNMQAMRKCLQQGHERLDEQNNSDSLMETSRDDSKFHSGITDLVEASPEKTKRSFMGMNICDMPTLYAERTPTLSPFWPCSVTAEQETQQYVNEFEYNCKQQDSDSQHMEVSEDSSMSEHPMLGQGMDRPMTASLHQMRVGHQSLAVEHPSHHCSIPRPDDHPSHQLSMPRPDNLPSRQSMTIPLAKDRIQWELDHYSPHMSTIQVDSQELERQEQKRYRNRLAAKKCREKKLEIIKEHEGIVRKLRIETSEMKSRRNQLKEEVNGLREQVIHHIRSGCKIPLTKRTTYQ